MQHRPISWPAFQCLKELVWPRLHDLNNWPLQLQQELIEKIQTTRIRDAEEVKGNKRHSLVDDKYIKMVVDKTKGMLDPAEFVIQTMGGGCVLSQYLQEVTCVSHLSLSLFLSL